MSTEHPPGGHPVRFAVDYPDRPLNRLTTALRIFVAIPIIVLAFLWIGVIVAVVVAWFAILFAGRYPRALFDYVVGVGRGHLRVVGYALVLATDAYPPFRLGP